MDGPPGPHGQVVLKHARTEDQWMLLSKPDLELARTRLQILAVTIVADDQKMSNFAIKTFLVVRI